MEAIDTLLKRFCCGEVGEKYLECYETIAAAPQATATVTHQALVSTRFS